MSDGAWICDYCNKNVHAAKSDEYYLWTMTHGWICGDCRAHEWDTETDSIYNE